MIIHQGQVEQKAITFVPRFYSKSEHIKIDADTTVARFNYGDGEQLPELIEDSLDTMPVLDYTDLYTTSREVREGAWYISDKLEKLDLDLAWDLGSEKSDKGLVDGHQNPLAAQLQNPQSKEVRSSRISTNTLKPLEIQFWPKKGKLGENAVGMCGTFDMTQILAERVKYTAHVQW